MKTSRLVVRSVLVVRTLGIVVCILVVAGVAGQILKYGWGVTDDYGLIRMFSLDAENNVPSAFSGLLLLTASLALGCIATLKRSIHAPYARRWSLLALVFLFMAFDEVASFHELLIGPMRMFLGAHARGMFFFGWVVPGIAVAVTVGLSYLTFLLHLPARTRWTVIIAAVLYLGGALGMELVGGMYVAAYGIHNLGFSLLAVVEESLEIAGVIVFIHALLGYIAAHYPETLVRCDQS